MGRRPLFGKSEIYASFFLGGLSLIMGAGLTFAGLYRHRAVHVLVSVAFYAGAAFYLREALHERRSTTT